MVEGSCLCGAVAWECAAPIESLTHCHCTRCRKSHGAPFATYGTTAASGFRVKRGREAIARNAAAPDSFRCFCSRCG